MERLIVKPIEDQLADIDNLDQLTATAQEGAASIGVQFKLGTDLNIAAINVQSAVDTARVYLPTDLDPPQVYKNGASEPLLDIAVSSKSLSPTALADLVTNRVQPLAQGDSERADRRRLRGVGSRVPRRADSGATARQRRDAARSLQRGRRQQLEPSGRRAAPADPGNERLGPRRDQQRARPAQHPAARPGHVDARAARSATSPKPTTATSNRRRSRTITAFRGSTSRSTATSTADEIKSTQIARQQIKQIEAQFPELTFSEIDAPADYTQRSLNGVWQSLFEGVMLTMIVMMLFLHLWRNAVVVMVSIPTSILSTFVLMNAFGFHLDTMSLMGLSLIIGILVDDSIVVLENITRHRDLGEDPIDAAINGRSEIGGAAVAITMVDVVVFLPIAFMPGLVGMYLKEFGAVIVIATLFSLFVSFTLTPLLAARWSVRERSPGRPKVARRASLVEGHGCDAGRRRRSRT